MSVFMRYNLTDASHTIAHDHEASLAPPEAPKKRKIHTKALVPPPPDRREKKEEMKQADAVVAARPERFEV